MTKIEAPRSIEDYTALVEGGTPFTTANIGDGEFLTITGWGGTNSDGRTSTPEKGAALAQVVLEPRITFLGYNPGKLGSGKHLAADAWLRENGVNIPIRSEHDLSILDPDYGRSRVNVRWVHKEIISGANVDGRLGPFLRALRGRELLVIGCDWLTEEFIHGTLGARCAVRLPAEVGWESLDAIETEVRGALERIPGDGVVTWSLGYLTKVLMWRLATDFPQLTQIDVGACWDPYCGVLNRHGYKKPKWEIGRAANLAAIGADAGRGA